MDLNKLYKVKHIREWVEELEATLWKRGDAPDLPLTTLPSLSTKLWGLRRKALTILGARTSQGKSSLALQIAADLANQGKLVWFLSLEMDVESLVERLFCHMAQVDNYSIMSGKFKNDEDLRNRWRKFKEDISSKKLLITCDIGKNWEDITKLLEIVGNSKPDVVVIDYVQNISMARGDSREIINEYLRNFRNMAIGGNFAGILCSQINRGAEEQKGHKPSMSQLKESGFLEESADVVMLLHWDGYDDATKHKLEDSAFSLIVAKNRNGRTGAHPLVYTPKFYRFEEVPANQQPFVMPVDAQSAAAGESVDDGKLEKILDLFDAKVIDHDRDMPRRKG